jgi:hypothetical protein
MKILQKIVDELSADDEYKYYVNIKMLLRSFLDYEVDIPNSIYENCGEKGMMGSAIHYLENLEGFEFLEENNSYNWSGRISHDFSYMMANTNDSFYVAIQIQKGSEVRCHSYDTTANNSYTDSFLLKFNSYQDFHELIDETVIENATFAIKIDGKTYLITPQIQREFLLVKYKEEDVEIDGICAVNDEELIEQIREYNNDKNTNIKKYY